MYSDNDIKIAGDKPSEQIRKNREAQLNESNGPDKAMVKKAHENGIICNVFWSDDPAEAREFLNMGIDTILINDYLLVSQILKDKE